MTTVGNGGSAWESNPAPPRWRGATGFEDREDHRAPFASTCSVTIIARRTRISRPAVAGNAWSALKGTGEVG